MVLKFTTDQYFAVIDHRYWKQNPFFLFRYFIDGNPSNEQYRKVFGIGVGVALLGCIIFLLLAKADIQYWDQDVADGEEHPLV